MTPESCDQPVLNGSLLNSMYGIITFLYINYIEKMTGRTYLKMVTMVFVDGEVDNK